MKLQNLIFTNYRNAAISHICISVHSAYSWASAWNWSDSSFDHNHCDLGRCHCTSKKTAKVPELHNLDLNITQSRCCYILLVCLPMPFVCKIASYHSLAILNLTIIVIVIVKSEFLMRYNHNYIAADKLLALFVFINLA